MVSAMRIAGWILLAAAALVTAGCGGGTQTEESAATASGAAIAVRADLAAGPANSVTVAWVFDLTDGWHLYWHGLNDSGYPPSVELSLPPGWTAGPLRWPVPVRYEMSGGILDHVYFGRLVLLQDLTGPDGARPAAPTTLTARVRWLACREACVPGQQTVTLTVPGRERALPAAPAVGLPDLPQPLPDGLVQARWEGDALAVTVPGARALRFFPDADTGPYEDLLADGETDGERMRLRLRRRDGNLGPVHGLLQIVRSDGGVLTGPFAAPARPTAEHTNHGG